MRYLGEYSPHPTIYPQKNQMEEGEWGRVRTTINKETIKRSCRVEVYQHVELLCLGEGTSYAESLKPKHGRMISPYPS